MGPQRLIHISEILPVVLLQIAERLLDRPYSQAASDRLDRLNTWGSTCST
jgi:hypothetical protein